MGPARRLPEALTPASLQRLMRSAVFGHRVFYYPSIGSTNERALDLAAAGEPEGCLVLAEEQTAGRGRRDRSWTSPSHLGIYASLILRPGAPTARAPLFTLMAAVSVAEALNESCALTARIKWPNDIVVGRRKIAGVLGELRGSDPDIREMVVGMGINVNHRAEDFPPNLAHRATSVRIEKGCDADRAPVLATLLEGFERLYGVLLRDGADTLLRRWESLSILPQGKSLVVDGPGGRIEGLLRGIDEEGALLVEGSDGSVRRIPFGEIEDSLWS